MNIKLGLASLAAAACVHVSHAGISASYGWEDGGTILRGTDNIDAYNSDANPYTGSAALAIDENGPIAGVPRVTVAFITGLQDGDKINASLFTYTNNAPGSDSPLRIWGIYGSSEDVNISNGVAGGTYPTVDNSGWDGLSRQWNFDSDGGTRDALKIEIRYYAGSNQSDEPLYLDDLFITVNSNSAQIIFPAAIPAPGALALLGLAGLGRRRRNS